MPWVHLTKLHPANDSNHGQLSKKGNAMANRSMTVLVVGATGSIGQLVVKEAIKQGHAVHALVRSASKGRQLARAAESTSP